MPGGVICPLWLIPWKSNYCLVSIALYPGRVRGAGSWACGCGSDCSPIVSRSGVPGAILGAFLVDCGPGAVMTQEIYKHKSRPFILTLALYTGADEVISTGRENLKHCRFIISDEAGNIVDSFNRITSATADTKEFKEACRGIAEKWLADNSVAEGWRP